MVQTSKPKRANTFIIEYSLLGTLRSKLDSAESEEPCTRKKTGRGPVTVRLGKPLAVECKLYIAFIGPKFILSNFGRHRGLKSRRLGGSRRDPKNRIRRQIRCRLPR